MHIMHVYNAYTPHCPRISVRLHSWGGGEWRRVCTKGKFFIEKNSFHICENSCVLLLGRARDLPLPFCMVD